MKTLALSKSGIILAIGGGILGGPVGIALSPATLAVINSITKKQGETTHRFLIWAILGAIGAPFSLILSLMGWKIRTLHNPAVVRLLQKWNRAANSKLGMRITRWCPHE